MLLCCTEISDVDAVSNGSAFNCLCLCYCAAYTKVQNVAAGLIGDVFPRCLFIVPHSLPLYYCLLLHLVAAFMTKTTFIVTLSVCVKVCFIPVTCSHSVVCVFLLLVSG